jgi:hypothetical protein
MIKGFGEGRGGYNSLNKTQVEKLAHWLVSPTGSLREKGGDFLAAKFKDFISPVPNDSGSSFPHASETHEKYYYTNCLIESSLIDLIEIH